MNVAASGVRSFHSPPSGSVAPACGLSAAAVVFAVMLAGGGGWVAVALAVWSAPVVIAAVEDAWTTRLRDAVVVPGVAVTFGAVLIVALLRGDGGLLVGAVVGAVAFGGWLLVVHLAAPAGMGYGDVKFGVLLGAGVGVIAPFGVVLVGVVATVVQVGVVVVRPLPAQRRGLVGRREAPFGPALAIAALLFVVIVALLRGGGT